MKETKTKQRQHSHITTQ